MEAAESDAAHGSDGNESQNQNQNQNENENESDHSDHSHGLHAGRTLGGTAFHFPRSRIMGSSIGSLAAWLVGTHTALEWAAGAVMALQLALFLSAPHSVSHDGSDSVSHSHGNRLQFVLLFVLWRMLGTVGLGALLRAQSASGSAVRLFRRMGLASHPPPLVHARSIRGPWQRAVISEIIKRIERNTDVPYDFDAMPSEFNAWILFQDICNFIFSNDLFSYVLFAISYNNAPSLSKMTLRDVAMSVGGALLVLFNIWLKYDAYTVLREYAWYWGDFFFIMDDAETFDFGFDTVPHPLYSIGHIGYYGVALITQSYTVLFVSLAAHISQILFLNLVESPHNAKIYGPPEKSDQFHGANAAVLQKYFSRDLVVFRHLDLFRSGDVLTLLVCSYTIISATLIGPIYDEPWRFWFYVGQTVFWRIFHTYGLGLILYLQGKYKYWNRHFIRHGDGLRDAFQHWKVLQASLTTHLDSLYNMSITMTYVSFCVCAWRLYTPPASFSEGPLILKHTLGALFILLHIWISISMYTVRGQLGWFYSDFFIDSLWGVDGPSNSGVYRYLENPLLYTFSCWGLTLICSSWTLLQLTIFAQLSNWLFLHFVVEPHQLKLYGKPNVMRRKTNRRSVRIPLQRFKQRVVATVEKLEIIDSIVSKVKQLKYILSSQGADGPSDGEDNNRHLYEGEHAESVFGENSDLHAFHSRRGSYFGSHATTDTDARSETTALTEDMIANHDDDRDERDRHDSVGMDESGYDAGIHDHGRRPLRRDNPSSTPLSHRSVSNTVRLVVRELEELVDTAKPRVQAMVDQTKLQVTNLANAANLQETLPREELPLHLYSLSFPTQQRLNNDASSNEPVIFQLGEPIVIEFTASRDTMKRKDWIALYGINQNFHPDVTTSKCDTRWSYVAGHHKQLIPIRPSEAGDTESSVASLTSAVSQFRPSEITFYDETASPWVFSHDGKTRFGRTEVTVTPYREDPGLRVVRGRLVFAREQLPWQVGTFEARYHYDGKYIVLARSAPFKISLDMCPTVQRSLSPVSVSEAQSDLGSTNQQDRALNGASVVLDAVVIAAALQDVIERCLDLNLGKGDEGLDVNEPMLDRIALPAVLLHAVSLKRYQKDVCRRIVYVIKHLYGIDFSWRVVEMSRTLMNLAERIHEAQVVLLAPPTLT
eukprot:jgi/Hompol1/6207/HPOL_004884-RA